MRAFLTRLKTINAPGRNCPVHFFPQHPVGPNGPAGFLFCRFDFDLLFLSIEALGTF